MLSLSKHDSGFGALRGTGFVTQSPCSCRSLVTLELNIRTGLQTPSCNQTSESNQLLKLLNRKAIRHPSDVI